MLTDSAVSSLPVSSGAELPLSSVSFSTDVYGYHHGQTDGAVTAWTADKAVLLGRVDFSLFGDKAYVNMIEVKPEFRRKGLGKALLRRLRVARVEETLTVVGPRDAGEPHPSHFVRQILS